MNFDELKSMILKARTAGKTTVLLRDLPPATAASPDFLDPFVTSHGFTGIGNEWHEISLAEANTLICRILERDLAYNVELMSHTQSCILRDRFLASFDQQVRFFTNGTFCAPSTSLSQDVVQGPRWSPITQATFDTGVVAADGKRIGMLWVEDED
jgi:hypothetical protein